MSKNKNRQPGRNELTEKPNKDIPVFRPFTPVVDNYVKCEMTPVVDIIEDDAEPTLVEKVDPFDMPASGSTYEHDSVYESIKRVAGKVDSENSGAGAGSQKVKTVIETAPKPRAGACHICGHVSSDAMVGEKVLCPNCGHTITLI